MLFDDEIELDDAMMLETDEYEFNHVLHENGIEVDEPNDILIFVVHYHDDADEVEILKVMQHPIEDDEVEQNILVQGDHDAHDINEL